MGYFFYGRTVHCIDNKFLTLFSWSGSDDNPNNNAGQGEAGSDRSNIILLADANYPFAQSTKADKPNKYGHWARSYPKSISESTFLGLSKEDAMLLAMAGPRTFFSIYQFYNYSVSGINRNTLSNR